MSSLRSDESLRDDAMRRDGLQTATFPTSTFVLTQPIALDAAALGGLQFKATATGDLTLHGVTRNVAIPVEGQFVGSRLVVAGATDIVFVDYNIPRPRSFSVLSIDDHGTLELQLTFVKQ